MRHSFRSACLILFATIVPWLISCVSVSGYINSEDVLKWEADISVFDSLNSVEYSDENTLLVTGSSSIRLWDSIHSDLAPFDVMQRGYGGAKLTDFNYYADRIIKPHTYRAIVIFIANDISGGANDRSPAEVFKLFKLLVRQIRERNPDTPVFWIEVTPTPKRWSVVDRIREAGEMISMYCENEPDLFFIPTADIFINQDGFPDPVYFKKDMLHLNREGYILWAERIKETLISEGIQY